ncbi:MAG TPA: hypothetical protein VLG68_10670, partial [Gammaproteobacteria bacterium]|nr:hypothetical protein [Gammaproteobacteria bacterium]
VTWYRGGETQVAYSAPNGPSGVVLDYYLKKEIKNEGGEDKTPVKIVVTDAAGTTVATVYGPSKQGINRFVWNMQYDAPTKLAFEKTPDLNGGDGFGNFGPSVLAGTYNIAVTVNGKTETTQAKVAYDPNQTVAPDEAKTLTVLGLKARNELSAYNEMMQRLHDMQDALGSFQGAVNGNADLDKAKYQAALDQAKALQKSLGDLKDSVYNTDEQKETIEDNIHYLAKLDIQLQFLFFGSAGSDPQPMIQSILDLDAELTPKVNDALARFNALLKKDVPDYNKAAYAAGAPTLMVGDPVVIKPVPAL